MGLEVLGLFFQRSFIDLFGKNVFSRTILLGTELNFYLLLSFVESPEAGIFCVELWIFYFW